MADASGYSATSQIVTTLQHDKINLQKRLTDIQLENQVLRRQLYNVSSLLDVAVSQLGALGISLETPLDIRALRADAMRRVAADNTPASLERADLTTASGAEPPSSENKRFQLRSLLREHTQSVQCCAFTPGDDPFIATAGLDGRLVLQNFITAEKQWDVMAHDENISDVAWFQGSKHLLSCSFDNTVKLWDPNRTERTSLFQHNCSGFVLSAVPLDKAFVFACADSRKRTSIVDTRAHKPVSWEHDVRVNSMAFDESTAELVTGHSNGTIAIWDIRRLGSVLSVSHGSPQANNTASRPAEEAGLPGSLPSHVSVQPPPLTPNAAAAAAGMVSPVGPSMGSTPPTAAAHAVPPLLRVEAGVESGSTAALAQCVGQITNETSHSIIFFVAHYHSNDDTKRLVCVSGDNMVRLYRRSLNASSAGRSELYSLRNVLPGVPTRGFGVRAGFWKGCRGKPQVSAFLDDGEKDMEQPVPRRLTECDLLATGGPDNTATVFDVTERGDATVVEHLEGHRDRVTGAAVHHSSNRPIIATTSADATVRIWVPVKT